MRAKSIYLQRGLLSVLLGISLLLVANPTFAQTTTSAISVDVVDQSGNAVDGVAIRITHLPTQRSLTASSNASGSATIRGLQVGGPYRVEPANPDRFTSDAIGDIMLVLGETELVDLVVTESSGVVEEVIVTAQEANQRLQYGVGSDFNQETLESIPSISRDFVNALATDPKILVDYSVARGPAVSIAGSNYRFNSVTVDGVAQNDNFGLSKKRFCHPEVTYFNRCH